ncbi:chromosomal partitioning protein ParB [Actinotalea ferrariae CF5-4]|uniref:Chromosomal partitioning protein ParB n=1 Tax=Actinotalea ferrariae CF5-4 TaxID=948458 RepID=A0A021VU08_9CELL|nr:ParB/RepB/Spo0J family partition protein [Actinotalea ferrariae]EYR64641.1 chromosomal partitioning protein ParB [Actinotalea ferrariae CF5-4]
MTTTKDKPTRARRAVPAVDAAPSGTGAGLDALTRQPATDFVMLALDEVHPHPANPRRDVGDLTELADSIRAHGIRQNLLVVPNPDGDGYRLVIGHRRAAAAREADLTHVPAAIDQDLDEAGQRELMLLENIQRTDLTPVEEADGYQGLLDLGVKPEQIAERTGRSVTTVRTRLRLAAMPEPARAAVHEHRATLEDAATAEEFAGEPEHDAILAALGTPDFAYTVRNARQAQELRQVFAPYTERLLAAGATERTQYGAPEGTVRACETSRMLHGGNDTGDWGVSVKRLEEVLADATSGWAFCQSYGSLTVYRPHTLEEAERAAGAEARQAEREAQWEAERAARAEAQRREAEQRAAVEEVATTSAATRRDFLLPLIHDRKLTAAHTTAVVDFVATDLITNLWLDDWWYGQDGDDVATWLRVDADAVNAQAEDDELDAGDALDQAVRAAAAELPTANRLLAAIACAVEAELGAAPHHWIRRDRRLTTWYALLERLGYPVSTPERTALAGDPGAVAA